VSRLQAGGLADRFLAWTTFVSLPKRLDWPWGPPSALFNGYQRSYPWSKSIRREADHKPQSSSEVKKEWGYACTPPYAMEAYGGTLLICLNGTGESERL
jgi:hypothetical protein